MLLILRPCVTSSLDTKIIISTLFSTHYQRTAGIGRLNLEFIYEDIKIVIVHTNISAVKYLYGIRKYELNGSMTHPNAINF